MGNVQVTQLRQQKTFFMTKNGLDNLKKRLDMLMHDRLEAVKRMRLINDEDREDSVALMDEVRRLEASEIEAASISNLLQYVEPIIKPLLPPQQVQIGSEVSLRVSSKKMTYTIVCPLEIDLEANKISEDSPLGRALLGKKLHETVTIPTRKGKKYTYVIVNIE